MSNIDNIKSKVNSLINGEVVDSEVKDDVVDKKFYQINCYTLSGVFRTFDDNYYGDYITLLSEEIGNAIKLLFKYVDRNETRLLMGSVVIEVVEDGLYEEIYNKDELTTLLNNIFKCGVGKPAVYKFIKVGDVSFRFNCETKNIRYIEDYDYMADRTSSIIFYMFNDDLSINEDIKQLEEKARLRKKAFYEANPHIVDSETDEEKFQWKLGKIRYHYDVAKNFDDIM